MKENTELLMSKY